MKKKLTFTLLFLALSLGIAGKSVTITLRNPMNAPREAGEMVELDAAAIAKRMGLSNNDIASIIITNGDDTIPSQFTYNGKLIFQRPGMKAKQTLLLKASTTSASDVRVSERKVFGRIFKERQDDFSFENDRLAYRFYGPDTQRRGEKLYGYDIFNKRTSALVLEEFYAGQCDNQMWNTVNKLKKLGHRDLADDVYNMGFSYHVDHGKGMDCYKVGSTLGAGTNALIDNEGNITYPWCYKKAEILDNGPLRLTIKLTYEKETRLLTVDAGLSMVKAEVAYDAPSSLSFCAGIAVHKENPDAYIINKETGIIAYEDLGDSEFYLPRLREKLNKEMGKIFIGCIIPDAYDCHYTKFKKETSGALGQVLAIKHLSTSNTYYFGNVWNRNNALGISTLDEWQHYLTSFAQQLKQPLKITVK